MGGFAAWRANDLPVEEGNVNYDVNAIEALTEEAEALLQTTQARIVSTPVRLGVLLEIWVTQNGIPFCFPQPVTVAAYGVAATAAVVALINYHTVLQFVGVAGSLGLAINWFTNFDTPEVRAQGHHACTCSTLFIQEAMADLASRYEKLSGLARKLPNNNKKTTQF